MPLSTAQTDQLLRAISPQRVLFKHGLAYLEAYEVKAHLNRCFGFGGWSSEVVHYAFREHAVRQQLTVIADAEVRLTVPAAAALYSDAAAASDTGSSDDAGGIYHRALTSAIAGAFKRAAANLGDQFGLSLYGDGSLDPIVAHVVGTDGAPSDIQEGCVTVSEEMADLRLRAKRMLADAARAANLPLDAVAKRFQAVHDVEIGRAHPAQIISTAQQIIDATNT